MTDRRHCRHLESMTSYQPASACDVIGSL